jgi:hypothetical protein
MQSDYLNETNVKAAGKVERAYLGVCDDRRHHPPKKKNLYLTFIVVNIGPPHNPTSNSSQTCLDLVVACQSCNPVRAYAYSEPPRSIRHFAAIVRVTTFLFKAKLGMEIHDRLAALHPLVK